MNSLFFAKFVFKSPAHMTVRIWYICCSICVDEIPVSGSKLWNCAALCSQFIEYIVWYLYYYFLVLLNTGWRCVNVVQNIAAVVLLEFSLMLSLKSAVHARAESRLPQHSAHHIRNIQYHILMNKRAPSLTFEFTWPYLRNYRTDLNQILST